MREPEKDVRLSHHYILGGPGHVGADSQARPWSGYQMTSNPTAGTLIGYLLVRGGVYQRSYALALEKATGVNVTKKRSG